MGLTPEMLQGAPSLTSQCPSPISSGNTILISHIPDQQAGLHFKVPSFLSS